MKTIKRLILLGIVAMMSLGGSGLNAQTLESDSLALVDLYNDCGGEGWTGFESWLNGPISTWYDVTVDSASQRVTHVEFSRMTLTGTLPESLGNLDQMSGKIQLNNQEGLTGELPAFLWNWVNVDRFQVKFCGFTSIDVTGMENMVNLTEFNSENTPIAGTVPGILFTLPAMEKLYLHDSEYDALPPELASVSGLDRLYLNGNNLTEIPDMSGVVWKSGAKVRFHNNMLDFADLEPNMPLTMDTLVEEFRYSPQAMTGTPTYTYAGAGDSTTLTSNVGGSANIYTWVFGENEVVAETADYGISSFDPTTQSGAYFALVQSSIVPGLDITTPTSYLFESPLAQDSLALVDLYNDCGGSGWTGFESWLNGPISTWYDVTVDSATQRVTHVEFSRMTLTGTLPSSLGNITKMSGKIQLNNQEGLTGELPAFVWNWVDVDRFQVKFCGFTSMDVTGMENMVNLTEFNSENTPIAGTVPGILFTLPAMEKLYLHDSEYDALPAEFTSVSGLDRLYLNGNNLSDIPDMSGIVWKSGAKVRFHNNTLDFADLEPNMSLTMDTLVEEFRYSPQNVLGEASYLYPAEGDTVTLSANIGGSANIYTWVYGEDEVVGETADLSIASFDPASQSGQYYALVQNSIVTGLDLTTPPTFLFGSRQAQDSLALVDLYNECGGADWVGYDTWLEGPLSMWEGVTLDSATGRVVHVEFRDMNLTGALPESLGSLDEMSGKIEFRDDSLLVGEMPAFLWNWTKVDRFQVKFAGYTSMDVTGIENMVNLTEFNTEGTPFTGTIPGEIFTLPAMVKLYFHNSEFDALPSELTQASGLDRLYLNGDNFSELPDMSGMTWGADAKIRVQDNFLTFEDLESNVAIAMDTLVEEFRYSPQANIGEETTLMPDAGSEVSLSVEVGGSENIYTWIKGEDVVGDSSTFVIDSYDETTDAGVYFALVQSALVPGLDIMSATTTLLGSPAVSDSLALVELYNECGGEEWVGYDTWLQGPISDWEGVTIDSMTGRVTNVEFRDMNLTGTLPESLGSLEEMSGKIEFRDDSLLVGEMPAFLWNWVKVDRFQMKFAGYTSMDVTGIENMVNLTEFNTEGTPFAGTIPGEIFTLPAMVKLYFHNSEFDALPAELTQASGLDRLYLNGDNFTDLPDMSGMTWGEGAKIRVQDNFLTFEDLESNVVITMDTLVEEFNYSPQANVGMADTIDLNTGDTLTISAEVGGSANIYTWVKGVDEVIDGQSEASLQIDSVTVDDSGSYFVLVQNATVPGLDIFSEATTVNVSPPSGVDEVPFEGLKVLGNPVDQRLQISSDELISQVSIFSVDGQLIYRQFPASNNVDVDMATYTSGLYLVMLQNETKYQIIKVAKD